MASVFCALVALFYATSMTTATELDERLSGVPLGKEGESGICVLYIYIYIYSVYIIYNIYIYI